MNKRQQTQQKMTLNSTPWAYFTFILIPYYTIMLSYSFEWLLNWNGTDLLFCWKITCLPRLETFKNYGCEIFFPDIKYLTDYNYDIVENEWTQKKYTRVEKLLVLALLFSKLSNSRFYTESTYIYVIINLWKLCKLI